MNSNILSKSVVLISLFLTLFSIGKLNACEIEFEIDGEEKETYHTGDILVVKVKVTFTHRVCTIGIKQTKFEGKGLKIMQGTDWKETSPGVWERKLKVKVTKPKKGKVELSAMRTCDKQGGFGSIEINAKK